MAAPISGTPLRFAVDDKPQGDFTTDGLWGFFAAYPTYSKGTNAAYHEGQTVQTVITDSYTEVVTLDLVLGDKIVKTTVTPTGLPSRTEVFVFEELLMGPIAMDEAPAAHD